MQLGRKTNRWKLNQEKTKIKTKLKEKMKK